MLLETGRVENQEGNSISKGAVNFLYIVRHILKCVFELHIIIFSMNLTNFITVVTAFYLEFHINES